MKVFKTILGYNDATSIKKVIDTFGQDDIHIFLDGSVWSKQIKDVIEPIDQVASVTILDKHYGIHLAPLKVYEYLPDGYTHLLHLDDDLILTPNYYDTLLDLYRYLEHQNIMMVSSDIHNTGIFSQYNTYQKTTPQWSNVLLSREYIEIFLSSEWYKIYTKHIDRDILVFCKEMLEGRLDRRSSIYKWFTSMPSTHHLAQDVFQNIYAICSMVRTSLIVRPRATLQRLDRTNTNIESIKATICKTSDMCYEYKPDVDWVSEGENHLEYFWKD